MNYKLTYNNGLFIDYHYNLTKRELEYAIKQINDKNLKVEKYDNSININPDRIHSRNNSRNNRRV